MILFIIWIAVIGSALAEPIVHGETLDNIKIAPFTVYVDIVNKIAHPKIKGKFLRYADTCAGTLISKKAVLTAAHCIPTKGHVDITIFAARTRLADFKDAKTTKMDKIIIHPGYYKSSWVDLAIIKLKTELNPVKGELEIVKIGDIVPDSYATALGWGITESGEDSRVLRTATLKIVPKKKCNPFFDNEHKVICAWADNRISTPCIGDSGGPLVLNGKLIGVLAKVLSKTTIYEGKKEHHSCHGDRPSVYVRVHEYLSWIQANK